MASLSPARREEYSLALAGVPDANDPGLKHVGGCLAEAHRALPGVYAAYGALLEPFEKLQEQIAADPRVVGAEARWSDCMRRRGLSFGRPRDVVAFVDESRPQARTDVGRAELMQQHARAFAVAGLCRREANLDATIAEVRYDHEARFVERYKEVLERYRG